MTRASFLLALAAVAAGCRGPVELAQERPIAAVAPGAAVPAPPVRPSLTAAPTLPSSYRGAAATPTGVVVPVLGASADGWLVGTPCGQTVRGRCEAPPQRGRRRLLRHAPPDAGNADGPGGGGVYLPRGGGAALRSPGRAAGGRGSRRPGRGAVPHHHRSRPRLHRPAPAGR